MKYKLYYTDSVILCGIEENCACKSRKMVSVNLYLLAVLIVRKSLSEAVEDDNTLTNSLTIESTTPINEIPNALIDMEIMGINVVPQFGNAVELFWGDERSGYNLNWTFGVYYGLSLEEAMQIPKLKTMQLSTVVDNLEYCKKYFFAVKVMGKNEVEEQGTRNFRNIGTSIDNQASPQYLHTEFLPGEMPCLLIKWSASCANILEPLAYQITIYEKSPVHITIITTPKTTNVDSVYPLAVQYGREYDIKVSTDVSGANSTETITVKIPQFLQPFNVKLITPSNDTFLLHWNEPFIPHYIGMYYYEVYVAKGNNFTTLLDKIRVYRPSFVYQNDDGNNNDNEFSFMVGLVSSDGAFRSYLTEPIES